MFGIRRPDPDYLTSRRSQANFKLALKIALTALAVLWTVHLVNFLLAYNLNRFGVLPRDLGGLTGILAGPLLHSGFLHLFNNSVPLVVLTTGMLYVYPNASARSLPMIYVGSGLAVWLLGRTSVHIGASGVIYGMLAFVFFSGVVKRDTRGIALSMLVFFLYGSMSWGILPQGGGISWESHLAGAVIGTFAAFWHRTWDRPPVKVYDWENEDDDEDGP